ncbi:hypothetical protein AVEN_25144-1 [Araneus ventricosus]|uniref:Uncharacterized protein n=1 Tax=Araneus ventricosus TaxID=182803 RepID=A0A4Y2IH85_ARAVE|nr:hypothetical protein AVEN_25144-1 [Araneus ventricosus]
MILAKDIISLTAGCTGTDSNPSKSHSGQSFFQAEVRVLLVTPHQERPHFHVFPIILSQATMWKRHFRNSLGGFPSCENWSLIGLMMVH